MRLHRLRLTAFGPFPGTEEVDLDDLGADGVFLLHGPTGAGKTSVLDAVCFALYGRVPGARACAGRLRSDHAPAGTAPEVELEFSVGSRRLRITRSPQWERPKLRGTGTTTAQASVVVEELLGSGWACRTTRLDEAGLLVDDLLGLGADQFTTLVMLPQGEFATFLRADAETRRRVLERLFRTDRFSSVQSVVRERRSAARQDAERATAQLRELVAQARQAARTSTRPLTTAGSDGDPLDRLGSLADDLPVVAPEALLQDAVDHVAWLRTGALLTAEQALAVREATATRVARADAALAEAVHRRGVVARLATLRERQTRLDAETATRRAWQEALEAGARAQVVASLLDRAEATSRRSADADLVLARWTAAAETAGATATDDPGQDVDACLARARRRRDSLVDGMPVWQELQRRREELEQARARTVQAETRQEAAGAHLQEATRRRAVLVAEREQLLAAAALTPAARARREAADAVLKHAREAERLAHALSEAAPTRLDLATRAAAAREHWLDLREQRLAGAAAELARSLADGTACPVCGSCEHPRPSVADLPVVPASLEQEARGRAEALAEDLSAMDARLAAVAAAQHAAAQAGGGTDPAAAAAAVESAEEAQSAAEAAQAALRRLDAALPAVDQDVDAAATAQREAAEAFAAAVQARARAEAGVEAGQVELARVLRPAAADPALEGLLGALSSAPEVQWRDDGQGALFGIDDPGVGASPGDAASTPQASTAGDQDWPALLQGLLDAAQSQVAAWEGLAAARGEAEAARLAASRAAEELQAALREAGFDSAAQARAAVLSAPRRQELTDSCRRHDDELAAVGAGLADLTAEQQDAATAEPIDLRVADSDVVTATTLAEGAHLADDEAVAALARAQTSVTELQRLGQRVTAAARRAAPVLHRLAEVDALARCLEGTGGDNTLRMSLSAFVLAARLEQVADAASHRLLAMTGGRFSLVHSDGAGAGGRGRSGLALRVVDAWTGTERETSSLSGGEAFSASLALALGLADVVRAEAGGTTFDTLFIDEGFGSLDPDALEEVLDTIDDLRSGGRTVGIVSHVGDLRDRIPRRLAVVKGRAGSRLKADGDAVPA